LLVVQVVGCLSCWLLSSCIQSWGLMPWSLWSKGLCPGAYAR